MTARDFIEMIRPFPDEERWELLDGEPFMLPPPGERHQSIVGNLIALLQPLARARGCRSLPSLGLLNDDIDDYAPIPDVAVRCGPMGGGGYARDPILLAEVLSPSTMNNDRGRKIDFYRSIPTLRTILVVYQDELRIEAWQREADDWTRSVRTGRDALLSLPELGGVLALGAVYEDVPLP